MKKFISLFTRHWAKSRGKLVLTLFAVALGTGILILSFSASLLLKEKAADQLAQAGSILWVSNGTWGAEGEIEQNRPPQWDSKALELVVTDGPSVSQAVPVTTPPFHEIRVGQSSYQLRNLAGTAPGYFDILNLSLAAGTPMTDEDARIGTKKNVDQPRDGGYALRFSRSRGGTTHPAPGHHLRQEGGPRKSPDRSVHRDGGVRNAHGGNPPLLRHRRPHLSLHRHASPGKECPRNEKLHVRAFSD